MAAPGRGHDEMAREPPIVFPSPIPEAQAMTPLSRFMDQQNPLPQTPSAQTPASHQNPSLSALMPPPSGPLSVPPYTHSHPSPSSSITGHSPIPPRTPLSAISPESIGIVPQLQNIVSTVNLGCKLDLKKIALQARNAEYNPKRFAAVIMRIRDPRTTALVFSSGKMVCTGAKSFSAAGKPGDEASSVYDNPQSPLPIKSLFPSSEDQSRLAARKYARIIQKLGFPARFREFKVQNMVGSCDVKFPIRLEGLVVQHSQFSSYEPELFPGLIYRMVKPRIVLLIFVSGKVVLTGAKERSEIIDAFNNIYPILKNFKKT